jgi:hypothetical protein
VAAREMLISRNALFVWIKLVFREISHSNPSITKKKGIYVRADVFPAIKRMRNSEVNGETRTPKCDDVAKSEQDNSQAICPSMPKVNVTCFSEKPSPTNRDPLRNSEFRFSQSYVEEVNTH